MKKLRKVIVRAAVVHPFHARKENVVIVASIMITEIMKVIVIGNVTANASGNVKGSVKVRVTKIAEKSIVIIKNSEMTNLATKMMASINRKHHQAIRIHRVHHRHRHHLLRNNQATTVAHRLHLRKGANMSMIGENAIMNAVIAAQEVGAVTVAVVVITVGNAATVIATPALRMTKTVEHVIHLRDMARRGNIRVPVHDQHTHLQSTGVDINSMVLCVVSL